MAFDIYGDDYARLLKDGRNPKLGIEKKTVGSTAVSFTHPLTGGIPYLLFSNGAAVYYTLDGTDPTLADGTTAAGLAAPNGAFEPIFLAPGETATLKAICSGSTAAFVTLQRLSLSSSV